MESVSSNWLKENTPNLKIQKKSKSKSDYQIFDPSTKLTQPLNRSATSFQMPDQASSLETNCDSYMPDKLLSPKLFLSQDPCSQKLHSILKCVKHFDQETKNEKELELQNSKIVKFNDKIEVCLIPQESEPSSEQHFSQISEEYNDDSYYEKFEQQFSQPVQKLPQQQDEPLVNLKQYLKKTDQQLVQEEQVCKCLIF